MSVEHIRGTYGPALIFPAIEPTRARQMKNPHRMRLLSLWWPLSAVTWPVLDVEGLVGHSTDRSINGKLLLLYRGLLYWDLLYWDHYCIRLRSTRSWNCLIWVLNMIFVSKYCTKQRRNVECHDKNKQLRLWWYKLWRY